MAGLNRSKFCFKEPRRALHRWLGRALDRLSSRSRLRSRRIPRHRKIFRASPVAPAGAQRHQEARPDTPGQAQTGNGPDFGPDFEIVPAPSPVLSCAHVPLPLVPTLIMDRTGHIRSPGAVASAAWPWIVLAVGLGFSIAHGLWLTPERAATRPWLVPAAGSAVSVLCLAGLLSSQARQRRALDLAQAA